MQGAQGATTIHRSAMFSTARCFLPVHPQPRVGVSRAPVLTVVSARPRRGGARRDRSWDDDGGGGSGDEDAIDESFFGDERDEEEEPVEPEEPSGRRRPAASWESPAGQLSGSDVLRALQRAAAAKMEAKKKKTKRNASASARPAARRQGKGVGGGAAKAVEVVGEARPIEIRREWAPRIRELELRVQQLLDRQHQ